MTKKRRNRVFGGSHVREAKPSAPPPPLDRSKLPLLFREGPRCACGETGQLRWVSVERKETDEEGGYRVVTTAAWVCAACRQGTFASMLYGDVRRG